MYTTTEYSIKTMILIVKLLCLLFVVDASHENRGGNVDAIVNKVNLSDNYVVEWRINEKESSVEFKVSVIVDHKGWVLLGFMNVPKNQTAAKHKPRNIEDSRGDFVITWPNSASKNRTTVDSNTMNKLGELEKDENSILDYQVTLDHTTTNKSRALVLKIFRKLETGDPQDVPITGEPLWMFGAYGNSDVYLTNLSNISSIDDTLEVEEVIIIKKSKNRDKGNSFWKDQLEKHWISVVLAVAGILTVVIIGAVYCCFRKGSRDFRGKKVKMTFYKEDEDDEARVAFLHSRT